ncbi:helix-turn-helix domain-containing protein [Kitasatospora sp. NPDC090091]|uniref:helix-turn-helix domain-containing protein n=1 Tax=Kitasatospora sp. NPDC090091 TaxID=3364081 RepID=UPI003826D21E
MSSMEGSAASKTQARAHEIAARLDRLIATENARREARGEDPITHREIAKLTGDRVSPTTVRGLHKAENGRGAPANPQVSTLDAIGEVFGIRNGAEYFTSDAAAKAVDKQLRALQALAEIRGPQGAPGDAGLSLAFRAAQLSPDGYRLVNDLAERLLAHELAARQEPDNSAERDG